MLGLHEPYQLNKEIKNNIVNKPCFLAYLFNNNYTIMYN